RANLPPEWLAVLGLLTPLLLGGVVCSFVLLRPLDAGLVALAVFAGVRALAKAHGNRPGKSLRFLVVDAGTGQPVPGAEVALLPSPQAGPAHAFSTDAEGAVCLAVTRPVPVERRLFPASSSACPDSWWFQVTAAGYEGTGRECLDWYTVWGVEKPD